MSIDYYISRASDWEATCVGSISAFATAGVGIWAFQFRSPSVCPQPVVFAYTGGGLGAGRSYSKAKSTGNRNSTRGISGSEDTINTRSERQSNTGTAGRPKYSGFTKLECEKPFSLNDLHNSGGRLSVAEFYVLGWGGAMVCITSFKKASMLFNSQPVIGSGIAPELASVSLATTVGFWKSEYVGYLVPSRGSSSGSNDSCSIHDLPRTSVLESIQNYHRPKLYDGPTIHAAP